MRPIADFFFLLAVVIVSFVVLVQITGCSPQYREVPQAVAEELAFQEAWTSDQARQKEKRK